MPDFPHNRRAFLASLSAVGFTGLAGCQSGGTTSGDGEAGPPGTHDACTIESATSAVSATPVSVDGRLEGADTVIDLRWNARSQISVANSHDANLYYEADEGTVYLVLRLEFTNTTTEQLTIGPFNVAELRVETPDTIDETGRHLVSLDEELEEVTLKPDGTTDGIVVYSLPTNATSATLRATEANFPERSPIAFDPTCDESLDIAVPEHEETV